jgi:hypothetical protein
MIRLLVIAISALMAATSASAAEIAVKVAGRSTPAVHADIVKAAKKLCQQDLADGPAVPSDFAAYCVREVTHDAVRRAHSRDLIAYDKAQPRSAYFMRVSTR